MRAPTQQARIPVQRTPPPLARPTLLVLPALLAVLTWTLICPVSPAPAADLLHRLTHGDQDALVVGTLTQAGEDEFTLGNARRLAGLPVPPEIRIKLPGSLLSWSLGSSVIASVDQDGPDYVVRWGVFLASSTDPETLTILDGSLGGGDRAAFQRYINSGGRDSEYVFIEGRTYLRKNDGVLELIYSPPPIISSASPPAEGTPAQPETPAASTGWNLGYLAGAAGVLILILFLFRIRPRPPRPPSPRA